MPWRKEPHLFRHDTCSDPGSDLPERHHEPVLTNLAALPERRERTIRLRHETQGERLPEASDRDAGGVLSNDERVVVVNEAASGDRTRGEGRLPPTFRCHCDDWNAFEPKRSTVKEATAFNRKGRSDGRDRQLDPLPRRVNGRNDYIHLTYRASADE